MCAAAPATAGAAVDFQREDLAAGGNVTEIGIGDLDGQHGPDIVTALYAGGISVRLNNGDGTFAAPVVYPTAGCAPVDLALGDVTGDGTDLYADGKLDVAVACDNAQIGRMAGDGAGHLGAFTQRSGATIGNSGSSFLSDHIALVRWRAPGLPPVLLFQVFAYDFSAFRNFPTLCTSWDWTTGEACQASSADAPHVFGGPIVIGDVNGVNLEEVVGVGGPEGLQILGVDGGSYSWADRQFGATAPSGAPSVAVGDLAADGFPDIVTSSSNSSFGKINVLHGDSSGLPAQAPDTVPSVPGLSKVAIGDFDGDGRGDVLGATGYGRAVVLSGDVDGHLGLPQNVPLVGFGNPAYASSVLLATADLDGNGSSDAVVVDRGSQVVQVLRNGNGGVPPPPVVPPGPGPIPNPPTTPPSPLPLPPSPAPKPPLSGLSGLKRTVTADAKGGLLLGAATNPPTKTLVLVLTVPGSSKRAVVAKTRRPKPKTIATATIRIPANAKRSLILRLGATGKTALKRHTSVKATLTIKATGTDGKSASTTRKLTIKRATRRH